MGSFSGVFPTLVIVMASDLAGGRIGDDDPLTSGHSGVGDFRSVDDADFDSVVADFIDGSVTLVGTVITMVRRDVTSLTFMPDGMGGTAYDATVAWELWGCAGGS